MSMLFNDDDDLDENNNSHDFEDPSTEIDGKIRSRKMLDPDRFQIHFTPDYSRIMGQEKEKYVYFNKPFGMKHWMEHKLGFSSSSENDNDDDIERNDNAIIILLDPDQLIMRPYENNNFTNTQWKFIPTNEDPYTRISHQHPMGQLYGFDLQWKSKINMTQLLQDVVTSSITKEYFQMSELNITTTTTTTAQEQPPYYYTPVDTLSNTEARRGYILGPPYIATARDMYQIVQHWSAFVPHVYTQYPHLLAEMFGYCLAAAHLQLPHQTAISFMVSDPHMGRFGEGWNGIDNNITDEQICTRTYSREHLPNVLHYCQRYGIGKYFFGKRRLPGTFLSCDGPLLQEIPNTTKNLDEYIKSALYPGDPNVKVYDQRHVG